MAITFVQGPSTTFNRNYSAASVSTLAVTYHAAVTSGNCLVACVSWSTATGTVTSVKDNVNNTNFTLAGTLRQGNGITAGVYYLATATAAGTPVVTLTMSAAEPNCEIVVAEVSGLGTTISLDVAISATAATANANPGSLVTTQANDFLLSYAAVTSTCTAGTASWTFTQLNTTSNGFQYRIVTSTGTYPDSFTSAGGGYSAAAMALYAGTSTQSLTPVGYANAQAFGNPALTGGTQTLTATGFANAQGFGNPTLTGGSVSAQATLCYHINSEMECVLSPTQANPVFTLPIPQAGGSGSGNCLIVGFQCNSAATIASVKDSAGNNFTQIATWTNATNAKRAALYYLPNCTSGLTAVNVSLTMAATVKSYWHGFLQEWYNMTTTPLDGQSSSSTSLSAGSFTPTTNGDLILYWGLNLSNNTSGSAFNGTSITAGSGFTLIAADLQVGHCTQSQIQTTAGAINPACTTSGSATWGSFAAAFKSANLGTPPTTTASYIYGIQHVSLTGGVSVSGNRVINTLQFPCRGNLLVCAYQAFTTTVSSITDSLSNSWVVPTVVTNVPWGGGYVQNCYVTNASTSPTLGSLTFTATTGTGYDCIALYDIKNGGVFDTQTSNTGNLSTNINLASNTITPSTTGGIVICNVCIDFNTINGLATPSTYLFDSIVNSLDSNNTGTNGTLPTPMDEDGGYGHVYPTSTSALNWSWSLNYSGVAGGGSSGAAFWTGVASSWKGPVLAQNLTPTGFTSANAFGTATVTPGSVSVSPAGLANVNAFGAATITPGPVALAPVGFFSANAFGNPTLTLGPVNLSPAGFANTQAFGNPAVSTSDITISPSGIASTNAFGSPTLGITLSPTGLSNIQAFGSPTVTPGTTNLTPVGIATTNAFGIPEFSFVISATGIISTNAFGATAVTSIYAISVSGLPSLIAFGTQIVTPSNTISPTGIPNTNVFGSAAVTPGVVQLSPIGIALSNAFGSTTVTPVAITLSPAGIASTNLFGTPAVSLGDIVTLAPNGIGSTNAFGFPTITLTGITQNTTPAGIGSANAFGFPSVSYGAIWISNGADAGGSGSYVPSTQSVQYIHNNFAATGDTIIIPNGTYGWSSGVSITKAINLQGQSAGSVTITDNLTGTLINIVPTALGNISVSNLIINEGSVGSRNAQHYIYVNYVATSTQPVLVFNNTFNVITGDSQILSMILWSQNGGVLYNNTFYGGNNTVNIVSIAEAIQFKNPTFDVWASLSTMGASGDPSGTFNTYVEDNTFTGCLQTATDCDDGSRTVIRHNTFVSSVCASHGYDTSPLGNRHWEFYNNLYQYPYATNDPNAPNIANGYIIMRGGTGVITGNTFQPFNSQNWGTGGSVGRPAIDWLSDSVTQIRCYSTYPIPRAVGQGWNGGSGTYNETNSWGSEWSTKVGYFTDPAYVWGNLIDTTHQSNFGTGGVNNYGYLNNVGCPGGFTSQMFIVLGQDFFFSSTSSGAKPGWSPYTYPHPLRSALPQGNITPSGIPSTNAFGAPTISRSTIALSPSGIANVNAFGAATVLSIHTLSPSSIPVTNAFGTPSISSISLVVAPSGIASTNAFGFPSLSSSATQFVNPAGIASTNLIGFPSILRGTIIISPAGIASTLVFGTAAISNPLTPIGIPNASVFGSPSVSLGEPPVPVIPTTIWETGPILVPAYAGQTQKQHIQTPLWLQYQATYKVSGVSSSVQSTSNQPTYSQREEGPWAMIPYASLYPQTSQPTTDVVPPPLKMTDIFKAQQTWPLPQDG
jgi:hypothetical protein